MPLQLFQDLKNGENFLLEVPYPKCGKNEVVIQNQASVISIGTERMLSDFARASYYQKAKLQPEKVKMVIDKVKSDGLVTTFEAISAKLSEPMALGYSSSGIVLEVGSDVHDLKPGDAVISNGPHSEVVCISRPLVAKIPTGVNFDEAAFTVVSTIALNGIRILNPSLGETVAVVGLGLLGQISLDLLQNNGIQAVGFDLDEKKIQLAQERGFQAIRLSNAASTDSGLIQSILQMSADSLGFDGVVITASSSSNEPFEFASQISRKKGRIVAVGAFPIEVSRKSFYDKELQFLMACSYGPGRYDPIYEKQGLDYPLPYVRWTENRNFQAVLQLLSTKKLNFKYLVSHSYEFSKSPQVYSEVFKNSESLGVILQYDSKPISASLSQTSFSKVIHNPNSISNLQSKNPSIALVGVGNFSKAVILPLLKKSGRSIQMICSSKGSSGALAARKYKIPECITDFQEALNHSSVNTIMISTPHHLHAKMVTEALKAKKNVFVEKPLAIDMDQLKKVYQTYKNIESTETPPLLMVGFNRRFSPFSKHLRKSFENFSSQLSMNYIVNAGYIPMESWVQDLHVGGGRMIGEGCHFIDLMAYISQSQVKSVYCSSVKQDHIRPEIIDNIQVNIEFENGSIGTLQYSSQGRKSYPKEQLIVMGGGKVGSLLNFRKLEGYGISSISSWSQDKGHAAEFNEFFNAIENNQNEIIPFHSLINTTLATFAAVRSLSNHRKIDISELEKELYSI